MSGFLDKTVRLATWFLLATWSLPPGDETVTNKSWCVQQQRKICILNEFFAPGHKTRLWMTIWASLWVHNREHDSWASLWVHNNLNILFIKDFWWGGGPKFPTSRIQECFVNKVLSQHLCNVWALSRIVRSLVRTTENRNFRPVISELWFHFILHWASRHRDSR